MEKEKTSPLLIVFRVIFTAALIACIAFIFRNSLETGAASSVRSQQVMQAVNHLLARVNLGPVSEHLIRKMAHFTEFALEGFLLMLCIRVYTKHFVRHMSWPLLGGMTTALMDETIQLHLSLIHISAARPSSSPTACRRCVTLTASWFWSRGASSSAAPTTS